jgi:hypothetical protein
MVKSKTGYLNNPFNHNWELVFLNQTPIQLQYNSAQIKNFTIQYNTILKLENVQQLNTIRAPHNCIAIQFTLNWPTLDRELLISGRFFCNFALHFIFK